MSTLTTGAPMRCLLSFFFHDTATPEIYTLSLHDALPICLGRRLHPVLQCGDGRHAPRRLQEDRSGRLRDRSEEHTSELQSRENPVCRLLLEKKKSQPARPPSSSRATARPRPSWRQDGHRL